MTTQLDKFTKNLWIIHTQKGMNLLIYELYLNKVVKKQLWYNVKKCNAKHVVNSFFATPFNKPRK